MRSTLKRLPEKAVDAILTCGSDKLTATFVTGYDGSGGHRLYNCANTLPESVDLSHFLVAGLRLNKITAFGDENTVVYENEKSSFNSERPFVLLPGKEGKDNVKVIMKYIDDEVDHVCGVQKTIEISYGEKTVLFTINILITQLDGKAYIMTLGIGGAFCTQCIVSLKDAQNPERIQELFTIDRSIFSINDLYDSLAIDVDDPDYYGDGEEPYIPRETGDYEIRQGLTAKPLTTHNIAPNFPILHAYLRCLVFFLEILYRFTGKVYKMGKGKRLSDKEKDRLKVGLILSQ